MAEHQPTPWSLSPQGYIIPNSKSPMALLKQTSPWREGAWDNDEQAHANAAFIVKAVNNHDALVEALEDLISDAERQMKNPSHHQPFSLQKARDALARVGPSVKGAG